MKKTIEENQIKISEEILKFEDIQKNIKEEIQINNPIVDGIINFKRYAEATTKILWVLKEPYSDKTDWTYQQYLSISDIQGKIGKEDDTLKYEIFRRILYISYGLINNIEYSKVPYTEEKEVYSVGEEIAYINIKKTGGGSQSDDQEIANAYTANEELLLKQIEEYEPNILIFGNTLKYFNWDKLKEIGWDLSEDPIIIDDKTKNTHFYPISKNKLVIHPWHPSYFIIGREVYCSEIINAGLQWREKNK